MKNTIKVILSLLFVMSVFVNIAFADTYEEVYHNEDVTTYVNESRGEFYSDIEINDYQIGERIVLYEYDDGTTVSIEIQSSELSTSILGRGTSSWSGGTLPSGNHVLVARIESSNLVSNYEQVQFNYNVSCYPVRITNAYNAVIRAGIWTISEVQCYVQTANASSSSYARASLTWTAVMQECGIVTSSRACYLNCEINSSGNLRVSWSI